MATGETRNVVLIMTDNQQASTLGCYGNPEAYTPNIDRLASRSVTFDKAYCSNAFCSPCRASVMTGLLPSQHGVHSWIDDRNMDEWPAGWHALSDLATLPELLKAKGYGTALVGKYHMGDPTTPAPGVDYWVTMEHGHVRSFHRNRIFDNGESYDHEGHTVDFFTGKAIDFIEGQVAERSPFFVFLPYPAPYGHWPATKEPVACRHTDRFRDCPMETVPRHGLSKEAVDGFLLRANRSGKGMDYSMIMRAPNDVETLRNYYAQISMVDDGVGRMVEALERLGVADDTLVIFTADHGLSLGHHGFWGHGGATFPSNMHHAAHSVPLIVGQGGKLSPGSRSGRLVSNTDVFATILDLADVEPPESRFASSSRSLRPALEGDDAPLWKDDAIFSEQEETRVVRTPKWALFRRFDGAAGFPVWDELYDVEADPEETRNLAGDPAHAATLARLIAMLEAFFDGHTRDAADMWRGGRPLQNSERTPFWRDAWGEDWAPVYGYDDGPSAK